VTSIETSIEKHAAGGAHSFAGRRAAFWFLLAVVIAQAIAVAVFYRRSKERVAQADEEQQQQRVEEPKAPEIMEEKRSEREAADAEKPLEVV
jgi:hypothetical protein